MAYYERYENLLKVIKASDEEYASDDIRDVEEGVEAIGLYINSIFTMERLIPIIRLRYEGPEIGEKIEELDKSRRIYHDGAMAKSELINKICKLYGVSRMFTIEEGKRWLYTEEFKKLFDEFVEHGIFKKE